MKIRPIEHRYCTDCKQTTEQKFIDLNSRQCQRCGETVTAKAVPISALREHVE